MECVFVPHCVVRPELCTLSRRARSPRALHQPRPARQRLEAGSVRAGSSRFSLFLVPVPFNDAGTVNSSLRAPSHLSFQVAQPSSESIFWPHHSCGLRSPS